MKRKVTKSVDVGGIKIGGGADISVQSMTNTPTADVDSTIAQIKRLETAGCDIIRVAVPDMDAANALAKIKSAISIPLVADIHFDYKLALASIEAGVDKLRINPGNIGSEQKVKEIALAAKDHNIPIRIGVNAGSIDKKKYRKPSAKNLVYSALDEIYILEKLDFYDIVISLKAFDVPTMIEAYRLASEKCDYPLHLGVTEAGLAWEGTIRSAVGIGTLLAEGIGDTLRVSLTADPVEEIKAGKEILSTLNLFNKPFTLISCPTCGRCEIDLKSIANEVSQRLNANPPAIPVTVAVMGCVVNGPGEASMADVGIAGGKNSGALFVKGKLVKKVSEEDLVSELIKEVDKIAQDS